MRFKVNRPTGILIGVLSLVVAVSVAFVASPYANAAAPNGCNNGPFPQFGRGCERGYFTNAGFSSGADLFGGGLPPSVGCLRPGPFCPGTGSAIDRVNGYISFIEGEETSGTAALVTAAEFIIDTQEGFAPGTRGQAWQPAVLADWENRLRKGVTDGTLIIDWNKAWGWKCNQLDTMYGGPNDVDAYYTFPGGETPSCGTVPTVPTIDFINATTGKEAYLIKRTCGNPFGKIGKLPDVPFKVIPGGFLNAPTVLPGGTGVLHVTLDNQGPNESNKGTLQVGLPANINAPTTTNPAPGQVPLDVDQVPPPGQQYGYHNTSAYGGNPHATAPDWYWNTEEIPKAGNPWNGSPTARFDFTVSPTAPAGNLTFWVCYYQADQNGTTACNPVTVKVLSDRRPLVVGQNGDVHAGGGFCGSPTIPAGLPVGLDFNGKVEGVVPLPAFPGQDQSEYVVSATAIPGVTQFASNSNDGNGLTETLGSNGGYRPTLPSSVPPYPAVDEVCREDLLGYAIQYKAAGGVIPPIPNPANQDVGALTAPAYWYNGGGVLHLHGTVSSNVTIVAESGTVEIDNNIVLSGGIKGAALGIIAAGNINISLAASRVDAYLFSDAVIDTCYQAINHVAGCVGANLTVNGFLMANDIWFHREGPFNVQGNPVTENIVLNPQIYATPPKFFDGSVDFAGLEGLGEKPPLY